MLWQKNNSSSLLLLSLFMLVLITAFIIGCLPANPQRTRVIDPYGVVVHEPPLEPTRVLQVPPTGRPAIDYIIGLVAAGIYGALGYSIRRTNGRVKTLESQPAAPGLGPDHPMTAEEIQRLAKLLAQVPERPGEPETPL